MRRVIFLTDCLSPPFDEGMKVFAFELTKFLSSRFEHMVLTNKACDLPGINTKAQRFGVWLNSRELNRAIKKFDPDIIIYQPIAALTNFSFVRVLNLRRKFRSKAIILISLQERKLAWWGKAIAKLSMPEYIFLQSKSESKVFSSLEITASYIKSGVSLTKFKPASRHEKKRLRRKYKLSTDAILILHVGHVAQSRNLKVLQRLAANKQTLVLLVASTSTKPDQIILDQLRQAGVIVWREMFKNVQEFYQMADIYVFPVVSQTGAIGMPISIIEALSCGLPIVTSNFGSLSEFLGTTPAIAFIDEWSSIDQKIVEMVENTELAEKAREVAERFSWELVFEPLNNKIEELIR